jgi:outer membrane lipoprotein
MPHRQEPSLARIVIRIIMVGALLGMGCAHVISDNVLKEVRGDISFARLAKDPLAVRGQTVLLGGVVVNTTYDEDGTLLEIYQTELDWEKRPTRDDVSEGRFLARYRGFLDSEIYKKGRKVTLAGVVVGVTPLKLGKREYPYPTLLIREIHLWKKKKRTDPCDGYPWYPWGMWGPWGPRYYPYGWY